MTSGYTLYGRPGSGSLVVQAALEEAGAPYERVWVGQEPAELEQFRAVNPTGRVPALMLPDGTVMFESAAMLIYIAEMHPDAGLAPAAGAAARAKFLQWIVYLSANVYESVLRIYYSARYSAKGDVDADAIRAQGVEHYLAHLELVGRTLAPYVLGRDFSLADLYLYMLVGWFPGEKADLWSRVPELEKHAERIAARPSVRKAESDHAQ